MYLSEEQARARWCPFARVDGNNRINNTKNDGFANAPQPYHCIADECMLWRAVHMTHMKHGAEHLMANHGYCGMGDRPAFE